jgi:hypothetical protein
MEEPMSLSEMYRLGKSNGYEGEKLDEWVEKRMNESEERRDRWCRREREKMETEARIEVERMKMEQEKMEAEARIEVERMKAEAAIEKERQEFELARMKNEGMKNIPHIDMNHQNILSKLPKFQEDSENIDAYIRRFETVARTTGLSNTQWGTQLLVLIGGKALDACQGLSEDQMKDYRTLKETLLRVGSKNHVYEVARNG